MVNPEDDDVKLFTTAQVGELCEVTTETVRTWIENGQLPALKINNHYRIRKTDLRLFLTERYHT